MNYGALDLGELAQPADSKSASFGVQIPDALPFDFLLKLYYNNYSKGKGINKMFYYEDTHMNHDCLNCSHSYITDEDDELHCPFRGIVSDDEWCEDWN